MSVLMHTTTFISLGWLHLFLMGTKYFSFKGEQNPYCIHCFSQHNCLYFHSVKPKKGILCISTYAYQCIHQQWMASYVPNENILVYFQKIFAIIIVGFALDNTNIFIFLAILRNNDRLYISIHGYHCNNGMGMALYVCNKNVLLQFQSTVKLCRFMLLNYNRIMLYNGKTLIFHH